MENGRFSIPKQAFLNATHDTLLVVHIPKYNILANSFILNCKKLDSIRNRN